MPDFDIATTFGPSPSDVTSSIKLRYEWPEGTRTAKWLEDIREVPVYFANKGISGNLCIETDSGADWSPLEYNGTITLKGKASLELLQFQGHAVSMLDARHSLIAGSRFRPVYVINIVNLPRNLVLRRSKVPFTFSMTDSSLDELQQLASSLSIVTPDVSTSIQLGNDMAPTMLATVKYTLETRIYAGNKLEASLDSDVKVFVSLDSAHLPPQGTLLASTFAPARSQSTSLQGRRASFWRRKSSLGIAPNVLHIDASNPEPFAFQEHSDAAATKITIQLTLVTETTDLGQPPSRVHGKIEWYLKTVTTVTPEMIRDTSQDESQQNRFQLRSRLMPVRTVKLKWPGWKAVEEPGHSGVRWQTAQDLWLTEPASSGLTPTFKTPYISHFYHVHLRMSITGAGLSSGLAKAVGRNAELEVPVQLRYDLGLAPSYTVDHGLPRYSEEMVREEEELQRRGTV